MTTTPPAAAGESTDHWAGVRSARGHAVDELISTLQKSIRRGELELALLAARELFESGHDAEELLWVRLGTISAEDCGDGSFTEPLIVNALDELRRRPGRLVNDRWLLAVHAIRFLAERVKDRTSDELANLIVHRLRTAPDVLRIPEYALDVHTVQGRSLGRTTADFWRTGATIANEREGRDQRWRNEILTSLENGSWTA